MTQSANIAVLGAGLSGLSASLHLTRRRIAHRLFEREAIAGGLAVTNSEQGFRFDRTGHLLHLGDPEMQKLACELLPESSYRKIERRSAVFSHGVFTRYPFQSNTYGLPPEVAYDCLAGFIAARFAPEAPEASEPRNFEEFCLQRFGAGFSKHFFLPYNERLWGVPARDITSEWCQRFVPQPSLEDVLRGAVGATAPELGYNRTFWYPELGMGAFAAALAERAPAELGKAPQRIDLGTRSLCFDDEVMKFEVLVSSIPLPSLLRLLTPLPEAVRDALGRLRWTHLRYLDLGLSVQTNTPYHWIYVPESKYPFYRVGCYSHFSEKLAPPGKSSLYVELVDRRGPSAERALDQVLPGLLELGVVRDARDVELCRLRTIDPAYVIYDHDYRRALDVIEPFLAEQRIVTCGRYGAWNYSSMEDALLMGRAAAARADALLSHAA